MNAAYLLEYLGHSSIYGPFDEFLTANGVSKRPKIGRSLDNEIFISGQGLALSFEIDAENVGIKKRSEGSFIFRDFEIMFIQQTAEGGVYEGPLPHGLHRNDSRSEIEKKLGEPKRRLPDIDNYYVDGLVWTVAFENDKLHFFQLSVPTNGKRKYGLCP